MSTRFVFQQIREFSHAVYKKYRALKTEENELFDIL